MHPYLKHQCIAQRRDVVDESAKAGRRGDKAGVEQFLLDSVDWPAVLEPNERRVGMNKHTVVVGVEYFAGALGLVGAFIFNGILLAVQLTGWAGLAAIISVIYSYFAWRNASDREHGTNLTV